jgi:hypothetical protein
MGMSVRFVIPAKAGIQNRDGRHSFRALRVWIPAFAGMTVRGRA